MGRLYEQKAVSQSILLICAAIPKTFCCMLLLANILVDDEQNSNKILLKRCCLMSASLHGSCVLIQIFDTRSWWFPKSDSTLLQLV